MFQQAEVHSIKEIHGLFPLKSVGKQCVPNCIMAVAYSLTFPIHRWQSEHLDSILVTGNNLYTKIASTHDYLLPSDIPEHFSKFRADFMINNEKDLLEHCRTIQIYVELMS